MNKTFFTTENTESTEVGEMIAHCGYSIKDFECYLPFPRCFALHGATWLIVIFLCALCVLCGVTTTSRAEVSCAPPGGYVKVQIAGNSENVVSAPLRKRGAFTGEIAAFGTNSLSFSSPGWALNQFARSAPSKPKYYLEFVSGDLTGLCFPIQSNDSETVVLDTGSCSLGDAFPGLGSLKAVAYTTTTGTDGTLVQTLDHHGDYARIRPAFSIGEVFTTGSNGVLNGFGSADAARQGNGGGDRIDLPANNVPGLLKQPYKTLCFVTHVGWRSIGDSTTNEADNALLPGDSVIVHRNAKDQGEVVLVGYPKLDRAVVNVGGNSAAQPTLSYVASPFSEPMSLEESGLAVTTGSTGVTGGVGVSPSTTQRGDEVQLFEGTHGPIPTASRRFISTVAGNGAQWQELGNPATSGTNLVLQPGRGIGILKRTGSNGQYWVTNPSFLR